MSYRIRQERLRHRWSQNDVAHFIGITSTAFRYIESGRRRPSYDVLVKLEDLFHMGHRKLFAVVNNHEIGHFSEKDR